MLQFRKIAWGKEGKIGQKKTGRKLKCFNGTDLLINLSVCLIRLNALNIIQSKL